MFTDKHLTCLVCGPYQTGDHVDHAETPGWVQSGGIAGSLMTCECCGGMGTHPTTDGTPRCQQARRVEHLRGVQHPATSWAGRVLERYDAETDLRTFASLARVYGTAKAETMMEQEPPL